MDDKCWRDCCVMRDIGCDSEITHLINMSDSSHYRMSALYFKLGVQVICLFVVLWVHLLVTFLEDISDLIKAHQSMILVENMLND